MTSTENPSCPATSREPLKPAVCARVVSVVACAASRFGPKISRISSSTVDGAGGVGTVGERLPNALGIDGDPNGLIPPAIVPGNPPAPGCVKSGPYHLATASASFFCELST